MIQIHPFLGLIGLVLRLVRVVLTSGKGLRPRSILWVEL